MSKVYYDSDIYVCWFVDELEDFYTFNSVNFKTNEESEHILSWSRNFPTDDLSDGVVRVYDVEIDLKKYYFLFYQGDGRWDIYSKNPMELEKLLNDKELFFVGVTK
jgi:hypothetical protein